MTRWLNPYAWLAAVGLAGALYGAHAWDRNRAASAAHAAGAAEVMARWRAEKIEAQRAAIEAEQGARAEEQRRAAAQREADDAAQRQLAAARADAAGARNAGQRLRDRIAALESAAAGGVVPGDPAATCECEAAGVAAGVLSELLRRADDRAGILAAAADEARAAGLACEAGYGALTP